MSNRDAQTIRYHALPWAGLGAGLVFWWLVTAPHSTGVLHAFSPAQSFAALWNIVASAAILPHLLVSLKRVLISLSLVALVGVPLGILIGISRSFDRFSSALFQFLRMISPLSWMPLAVMAFGIGDAPVYFLLTVAAVWPIVLSTAAGVAAVEPHWLQLARSLSATRWETVCSVVVPAIVSHILTGLRLAIGIIWIVLVPAEMLGVSAGLGYFILDTRDRLAYAELMAVILVIGALGYLIDALARFAHRRWSPGF